MVFSLLHADITHTLPKASCRQEALYQVVLSLLHADLKNACEIFPMSMVAAMVGVKPLPFFEVEEAVREGWRAGMAIGDPSRSVD